MNAAAALLVLTVAAAPATSWAGNKRTEQTLQSLVSQHAVDQAFEVVSNQAASLQNCFKNVPGAQGAPVELSFTIGKAGRATDIRVESPALKTTTVPACIAAAVARWPFPASVGARVSFPLEFAVQ